MERALSKGSHSLEEKMDSASYLSVIVLGLGALALIGAAAVVVTLIIRHMHKGD